MVRRPRAIVGDGFGGLETRTVGDVFTVRCPACEKTTATPLVYLRGGPPIIRDIEIAHMRGCVMLEPPLPDGLADEADT